MKCQKCNGLMDLETEEIMDSEYVEFIYHCDKCNLNCQVMYPIDDQPSFGPEWFEDEE